MLNARTRDERGPRFESHEPSRNGMRRAMAAAGEPDARQLFSVIYFAKVNGLFSERDMERHYRGILARVARETTRPPGTLETAFRASYGMSPLDFITKH